MPRPRATNPLNLPPRVAFKHGAFYYRHRDGRWERLGLRVHTKPNGRPLISRTQFETVMAGRPSNTPTTRPAADAGAVVALFRARRVAVGE